MAFPAVSVDGGLLHLNTSLSLEGQKKTKSAFEQIFEKYGKDFTGESDEIDLITGKVVVDNGELRRRPDEINSAWNVVHPVSHDSVEYRREVEELSARHRNRSRATERRRSIASNSLSQAEAAEIESSTIFEGLDLSFLELDTEAENSLASGLDLQDPQAIQQFIIANITRGIRLGFQSLQTSLLANSPATPRPNGPRSGSQRPNRNSLGSLHHHTPYRRPGSHESVRDRYPEKHALPAQELSHPEQRTINDSESIQGDSQKSLPPSNEWPSFSPQALLNSPYYRRYRSLRPYRTHCNNYFTPEDDALLIKMKMNGASWDTIAKAFPKLNSVYIAQNRWSKFLKHLPVVENMAGSDGSDEPQQARSREPYLTEAAASEDETQATNASVDTSSHPAQAITTDIFEIPDSEKGLSDGLISSQLLATPSDALEPAQEVIEEEVLTPAPTIADLPQMIPPNDATQPNNTHHTPQQIKRSRSEVPSDCIDLSDVPFHASASESRKPSYTVITDPSSELVASLTGYTYNSSSKDKRTPRSTVATSRAANSASTLPTYPKHKMGDKVKKRRRSLLITRRLSWTARKQERLENRAASRQLLDHRIGEEQSSPLATPSKIPENVGTRRPTTTRLPQESRDLDASSSSEEEQYDMDSDSADELAM